MAKRKDRVTEKPQIEGKFLIYISLLLILGSLSVFIFILGADFGFFSFGGTDNPFTLLWIAGVGLGAEYFSDLKYTASLFDFTGKKANPLRYVPLLGIVTIYYPIHRKISYLLLAVGALASLIAFTPLVGVFGVNFLVQAPVVLATIAFICVSLYIILRGVVTIRLKGKMVQLHDRLGGEGASGTSFLRGLFYYLPIGRALPMLQDANFISTVHHMKQESQKQDQGEY